MTRDLRMILCIVLVAVLINLVLPLIVKPMVNEKKMVANVVNGGKNFFDDLATLILANGGVPVSSSVLVALVVGVSLAISRAVC